MPVKGARLCGAKCRSKNWGPCERPAVKGGLRCRLHGGKGTRYKHGRYSHAAREERKAEDATLKEMKQMVKDIEG